MKLEPGDLAALAFGNSSATTLRRLSSRDAPAGHPGKERAKAEGEPFNPNESFALIAY
jgi:hypothetical protein